MTGFQPAKSSCLNTCFSPPWDLLDHYSPCLSFHLFSSLVILASVGFGQAHSEGLAWNCDEPMVRFLTPCRWHFSDFLSNIYLRQRCRVWARTYLRKAEGIYEPCFTNTACAVTAGVRLGRRFADVGFFYFCFYCHVRDEILWVDEVAS
jgi:hypothetical protein